jgi:glycine cleavage system H protein
MSDQPITYAADRKYTETHEWAKMEGDVAVIGITDFAQSHLGDIVYVELKPVGTSVQAHEEFGNIDSVKASSPLYTPLSGKIEAINTELGNSPVLVNQDPYGAGWMIKVRPSNSAELSKLLDAATYQKKTEAEETH